MVTAVNAGGGPTSNYRGALFKLVGGDFSQVYSNNGTGPAVDCKLSANLGTSCTGANAPASLSGLGNGTATYTAASSGSVLVYARSATTPEAPYTADVKLTVNATDANEASQSGNPGAGAGCSGACAALTSTSPLVFNSIAFDASAAFRYGIVTLQDVYVGLSGNSSGVAPVTIQARYWNNATSSFDVNTLDQCTTFTEKNFVLSTHRGAVTSGNLPTPTAGSDGALSMSIGTLVNGVGRVNVTAPGSISSPGSARICLDLDRSGASVTDGSCIAVTPSDKAHLQGPWSGGSYAADPGSMLGFGLYGSQPKNFIYFRENY
jgi:hypothetical protein